MVGHATLTATNKPGDGLTRATGTRRRGLIAAVAGWVLAATWLQLVRGPGQRAYDVMWAEDSTFLNQAMRHGLWHNLTTPHAGYLQVVARLLAQPAAHLPLEWAAAWLAASAAIVVALISVLVWFASGRLLRSRWARGLVAALVPLLPQAGFEINAAVNDLHWYLAFAAFWVLLAAPRSVRGQAGAAAVCVLAALSDPLTALVLPAALVGVLRAPRKRIALIAPAAMLVALAVQGWVHLAWATDYRASTTDLTDLPVIYGLRVVLSALTGDHLLGPVYQSFGLLAVIFAVLVAAAGLAVLIRLATPTVRPVVAVSLVSSIAYLVVAVGLRGTADFLDREDFSLGGSRYTVVPLLLLWTAIIVLLDQLRTRTFAVGITAAFLAVQLLSDWAAPTVRSNGPSWRSGVRTAAEECKKPAGQHGSQATPLVAEEAPGAAAIPIVPGPDDVTVLVAPQPVPGQQPLFAVVIDCTDLR